jgi:hypothetical protein
LGPQRAGAVRGDLRAPEPGRAAYQPGLVLTTRDAFVGQLPAGPIPPLTSPGRTLDLLRLHGWPADKA